MGNLNILITSLKSIGKASFWLSILAGFKFLSQRWFGNDVFPTLLLYCVFHTSSRILFNTTTVNISPVFIQRNEECPLHRLPPDPSKTPTEKIIQANYRKFFYLLLPKSVKHNRNVTVWLQSKQHHTASQTKTQSRHLRGKHPTPHLMFPPHDISNPHFFFCLTGPYITI